VNPPATESPRIREVRESIIAAAFADVEQRLLGVRCPVDGEPLTEARVEVIAGQPRFHIDGCCGAVAEARRAIDD
jgi:hypothetical protein